MDDYKTQGQTVGCMSEKNGKRNVGPKTDRQNTKLHK